MIADSFTPLVRSDPQTEGQGQSGWLPHNSTLRKQREIQQRALGPWLGFQTTNSPAFGLTDRPSPRLDWRINYPASVTRSPDSAPEPEPTNPLDRRCLTETCSRHSHSLKIHARTLRTCTEQLHPQPKTNHLLHTGQRCRSSPSHHHCPCKSSPTHSQSVVQTSKQYTNGADDYSPPSTDIITLTRHVLTEGFKLRTESAASGDLTILLSSLQTTCKFIESNVRKAA